MSDSSFDVAVVEDDSTDGRLSSSLAVAPPVRNNKQNSTS